MERAAVFSCSGEREICMRRRTRFALESARGGGPGSNGPGVAGRPTGARGSSKNTRAQSAAAAGSGTLGALPHLQARPSNSATVAGRRPTRASAADSPVTGLSAEPPFLIGSHPFSFRIFPCSHATPFPLTLPTVDFSSRRLISELDG